MSASGEGLVFGTAVPFSPKRVSERAATAWAGVKPITLHEARHTFASLMIAAGVNAKALSTYMGHANIAITLDSYGHLMPGNEEEAAGLLDAYLEREHEGTARADRVTVARTVAHPVQSRSQSGKQPMYYILGGRSRASSGLLEPNRHRYGLLSTAWNRGSTVANSRARMAASSLAGGSSLKASPCPDLGRVAPDFR